MCERCEWERIEERAWCQHGTPGGGHRCDVAGRLRGLAGRARGPVCGSGLLPHLRAGSGNSEGHRMNSDPQQSSATLADIVASRLAVVPCPALDDHGLADDPRRLDGDLALRPLHDRPTGRDPAARHQRHLPPRHPPSVALDGADVAAVRAQVRDLERTGEVGGSRSAGWPRPRGRLPCGPPPPAGRSSRTAGRRRSGGPGSAVIGQALA